MRAINWAAVEPVDVLVAGFPCQDISAAGKRIGIEKGERSGLWTDIVAGLRVLRPALLIVENVAAHRWPNGGLHRVLGDLAEAGYDALWRSVRASDIGAPHRRERVFLLAWPRTPRTADAADATSTRRRQPRRAADPARRRALGHQVSLHDAVSAAVKLLPTPTAINPNDAEEPSQWLVRREKHRTRKINGHGIGIPLSIAVRLQLAGPPESPQDICRRAKRTPKPPWIRWSKLPDAATRSTTI